MRLMFEVLYLIWKCNPLHCPITYTFRNTKWEGFCCRWIFLCESVNVRVTSWGLGSAGWPLLSGSSAGLVLAGFVWRCWINCVPGLQGWHWRRVLEARASTSRSDPAHWPGTFMLQYQCKTQAFTWCSPRILRPSFGFRVRTGYSICLCCGCWGKLYRCVFFFFTV